MILIIGGVFQGKTEYAKENYENARERIFYLNGWARGRFDEAAADDGTVHDGAVSKALEILKRKISEQPDIIIITDEIGRGVVPVERKEREFREFTGRLQISLAKNADEVIRVTCGIGQKLK